MQCLVLATLFFLQTTQTAERSAQTATAQAAAATESKQVQASSGSGGGSRSTMIIDPKARADDYKKAFELLKAEKSTSKVYFQLADGSEISNVIDMDLMPASTLVLFRYSTPQGIKFHAVEIENLLGISHK